MAGGTEADVEVVEVAIGLAGVDIGGEAEALSGCPISSNAGDPSLLISTLDPTAESCGIDWGDKGFPSDVSGSPTTETMPIVLTD